MSTNKNSKNLILMSNVKYNSKSIIYAIYPPFTFQYLAEMTPKWPTCLHSKGSSIFFLVTLIAFLNWFKLTWLVVVTHAFKCTHILWSKGLKLELEGGQQYLNQNWAIWMSKNVCIDPTGWAGILSWWNAKLFLIN